MPNHKEPIIALARVAYNLSTQSDDEVIERVQNEFSVDLEDVSDDQIDMIQEELLQKKRQSRKTTALTVPVPAPQKIADSLPTLTDFRVADRVKHVKFPEWGVGDVLAVTPYVSNINSNGLLQKLEILFSISGRKTIIANLGLIERV